MTWQIYTGIYSHEKKQQRLEQSLNTIHTPPMLLTVSDI